MEDMYIFTIEPIEFILEANTIEKHSSSFVIDCITKSREQSNQKEA